MSFLFEFVLFDIFCFHLRLHRQNYQVDAVVATAVDVFDLGTYVIVVGSGNVGDITVVLLHVKHNIF